MKKKRIFFNLKRPYVFVPMTLDYFHHGHANILKIARKYGALHTPILEANDYHRRFGANRLRYRTR